MNEQPINNSRISSIDLMRGIAMIMMTLDHVRDYFHADSLVFEPNDFTHTNTFLFLTRWVTHFCAPAFIFLTGVSAFLSGQRKTKNELSIFLLTRGAWLIVLEVTIVSFGWSFNVHLPFFGLQVIWAIGVSMICLAGFIHLNRNYILVFGWLIIAAHNLLDSVHFDGFIWAALHEPKLFHLGDRLLVVSYPLLPWVGVMAVGYCCGAFYAESFEPSERRKILLRLGLLIALLFVAVRWSNIYGDPTIWSHQGSFVFTLLSFLDVTKYPPSLLFILMTMGPCLILLSLTEKVASSKILRPVIQIGRVPLFYYIIHIYLIHLLAMFATVLCDHQWSDMILVRRTKFDPKLKGYGFSLAATYLVWMAIILMLFPLCRWYDQYKTKNKAKWWLSYL